MSSFLTTAELAFFENLPERMSMPMRNALEGIWLAAETISVDYSDLIQISGNVSKRTVGIQPNESPLILSVLERVRLFRAAWSIVERYDAIRQFLHSLRQNVEGENPAKSESLMETGRQMRNDMAHLAGGLKNLEKKKSALPAFGVITVAAFGDKDLRFNYLQNRWQLHGYNVIVMTSSTSNHPASINLSQMTSTTVYNVVGNAMLHAFDKSVHLEGMLSSSQSICRSMAASGAQSWRSIAEVEAAKVGMSVEEFSAPNSVRMQGVVRATFQKPQDVDLHKGFKKASLKQR